MSALRTTPFVVLLLVVLILGLGLLPVLVGSLLEPFWFYLMVLTSLAVIGALATIIGKVG